MTKRKTAKAQPAPAREPAAVAFYPPEAVAAFASQFKKGLPRIPEGLGAQRRAPRDPFTVPWFPKNALPGDKAKQMAADSIGDGMSEWSGLAGGGIFNTTFAEGMTFLGFTYLALLAQRPEYRVISETVATEMTRKWIKIKSKATDAKEQAEEDEVDEEVDDEIAAQEKVDDGAEDRAPGDKPKPEDDTAKPGAAAEKGAATEEDAAKNPRAKIGANGGPAIDDKSDKIKEVEDFFTKLDVRGAFRKTAEYDGFMGRAHLFMDFGNAGTDTANADELKTPIGNGHDAVSQAKCSPQNPLVRLQPVEALWCYPTGYNSSNPLAADWYKPQNWYSMGTQVHVTRLLPFVGREVPDQLKPAYAFGGLSLSQMVQPYVDNWLRTRQSVADIISAFSVMVLATDLSTLIGTDGVELLKRADLFNNLRNNKGLMLINKEDEEFQNVAAPLGTLDKLQAQTQEHMASVSRIPLVKLLGTTPAGLNASSEGEIRVFYDTIAAYQERFFRPHLTTVFCFAQLSLWGEVDPDLTFDFEPLWSLDDKQEAEVRKTNAETDTILINGGVIAPEESRKRVAADKDSPYSDIDVEDIPEPPEPVDAGNGDDGDAGGGTPGGGSPGGGGDKPKPGVSKDAALPFVVSGRSDPVSAYDESVFKEGEHPRAPDGKFGSGGGKAAALHPEKLTKVGKQMGSNPGGVYADAEGTKFYVKRGQSPEHVKNERLAASLYSIAGAPTLNYRDVDGGNHVATEMAKLDKARSGDFTPAEKKAAAQDFVVHAWLSNWDAVGTGGDNLGTVNGKPTALDLGGALQFRAQGAPKGSAFGDKVSELETMRNPSMSPDAAKIFGKMTPAELKAAAKKVTAIPDGAIRDAVKGHGVSEKVAATLIARKADIAKQLGIAMDSFEESDHPRVSGGENAGQFAPKGGGGGPSLSEAIAEGSVKTLDMIAKNLGLGGWSTKLTAEEKAQVEGQQKSDYAAAKAKAAGGSKPKKTAFGGLWKANGANPAENFLINANYAIGSKGNGQSMRQMLKHLINESSKYSSDLLPKLKKRLSESYSAVTAELEQKLSQAMASGASNNEIDKLADLKNKANKQAAHYAKGLPIEMFEGQKKPEPKKPVTPQLPPPGKKDDDDELTTVNLNTGTVGDPPAPKLSSLTAEQIKKAKKNTPIPVSTTNPEAVAAIKAFNDKYAGKEIADAQVPQKIADYAKVNEVVQGAATEEQKKQLAAQAKAQAAVAAKAKKEADAFAAQFSTPEAKEHFATLSAIIGGTKAGKEYLKTAEARVNAAGLKGKIDATSAALIVAYSGSHYREVNQQLRKGMMTAEQYKYTKGLNAALEQLPAHAGVTYRKADLPADVAKLYQPGYIVAERGFTSSSKKEGVWSGSYRYVIEGHGGRDIEKLSSHGSGEAEVLFKANSHFMVTKVEGNKIHLKEV